MRVLLVAIEDGLKLSLQLMNLQNVDIAAIITVPTNNVFDMVKKYPGLQNKVHEYGELRECCNEMYWDTVVVCGYNEDKIVEDLMKIGVERQRIINFSVFRLSFFWGVYNVLEAYKKDPLRYKNIITGMSYAVFGINALKLKEPAIKLAFDSQDFFYDYKLARYALDLIGDKQCHIKNIFINMAPYKFHYDLSRSKENYRCLYYYKVIKDLHNHPLSNGKAERFFSDAFMSMVPSNNDVDLDDPHGLRVYRDSVIGIKEVIDNRDFAGHWEKRWFEDTVKENVDIVKEFLDLCYEKGIRPVMLAYPVHNLYRKYFPKKTLDQYYSIIRDLQREYSVDFLDYWASDMFTTGDFWDTSHLNYSGATKMINIVNDFLS